MRLISAVSGVQIPAPPPFLRCESSIKIIFQEAEIGFFLRMDLLFLHRAILKNPIASSIPVTGLGVTSLSLILLPEFAGVSANRTWTRMEEENGLRGELLGPDIPMPCWAPGGWIGFWDILYS